jgi:hypothetical protein
MKKMILKGMVGTVIALTGIFQGLHAQDRGCGTMEHLEWLQHKDPSLASRMSEADLAAEKWLSMNASSHRIAQDSIVIPVVFHLIYKYQAQQITDAQILSQLDVLNEDFNALNPDYPNVPAVWDSVKANCGIRFCLAARDPQGNPSTGITRTQTWKNSFTHNDSMKFAMSGGHDAWPATEYLNVWICALQGTLLGYAQFPNGPVSTDGVVMDYQALGRVGNLLPGYGEGGTCTHEVAHWLGVYHTFQSGCGGQGDFCGDTPPVSTATFGSPTFPHLDPCSPTFPGIQFMNFMDYSDDSVKVCFTKNQKSRMHYFFQNFRSSLLHSQACDTVVGTKDRIPNQVSISPNPSNGNFEIDFNTIGTVELTVFDAFGKPIEQRIIQAAGATKLKVDLSGKTAGFYFVRLQFQGGQTTTHKVIVQ